MPKRKLLNIWLFCQKVQQSLYIRQRLNRPKAWVYLIIVILIIVLLIGIVKNYFDSDYQFLHWHTKATIPVIEHFLCVLVPFRDRLTELQIFIPHLDNFLNKQHILHQFIVLNQTDTLRFNRASLINVGWYEADRIGCDYMVMHDVDLIPLNQQLDYTYPGRGVVRHISSPEYHPKYRYSTFIGGILMLTMVDFKALNGMSNKYWGWGLEDDEFYLRLRDANMLGSLQRPKNLTTDRTNTFQHIHDTKLHKRDYKKYGNQKQMTRQRDRISGLNTVNYSIVRRNLRTFKTANNSVVVSILDIELTCNMNWTNYCKIPELT